MADTSNEVAAILREADILLRVMIERSENMYSQLEHGENSCRYCGMFNGAHAKECPVTRAKALREKIGLHT